MNAADVKSASVSNKTIVLVIATITSFILPFLIAAVNVALPTMGEKLGMEAVTMSWVSTVYFLAIAVAQVPFGRLSDIFGRRRLFIIGLFVAAFSCFLGGFANSAALLIVSRGLQGIGAGIIFNNSTAILSSVYPSNERGRALGISMAGVYAGLSFGPLIGGLLTEHLGWQSIFYTAGILNILLIVLVFLSLKGEWREAVGEKFDFRGSIAFSISIAIFMYGFSALPSMLGVVLFVVGAVGLYLFVRLESRTSSPIFHIDLFRSNRVFLFSNLAALITYLSTFAMNFLLSLYLQYIKGYSAETAGLVLVASSVLMTVFTPISGRISDRVEPRLVATLGAAINCVSLVMLVFLGTGTQVWFIIIALLFYGLGIGLFASPNINAIMGSVKPRMFALASGIQGTMRTSGMMLSMGIMMVLFSIYIGQAEITPQFYPQFLTSVQAGFIIFTVLGILGVVAQLMARQPLEKAKAREARSEPAVH